MICEHCAHPPSYKAREAQWQPYFGMWQALCAWEAEQNQTGVPTPLRQVLYRIASEQPNACKAVAVNTTRYGRENEDGC